MSRLVWLAVLGCATSAPAAPGSVSLGTGGAVVSLSSGTLYLMDPQDGIVAVDVRSNRRKWAAGKLAAKPFAEVGGAVLGADEAGVLKLLDARTGKPWKACPTLAGPRVPIVDSLGSSQSSWGIADSKRAWIVWSQSTHYAGGAAPSPEMEKTARSQSNGVHEIDVAACSVAEGKHPFTTPPRALELAKGKPMSMVTADLRHVIVGEELNDAYAAAIFDVATGQKIAEVSLPVYPQGCLLLGRRLLIGGPVVWLYDLDQKRMLWSHALRETRYMGPYPP